MPPIDTEAVLLSAYRPKETASSIHGVQCRMISVDNFFVFLRLLLFALLLLHVT